MTNRPAPISQANATRLFKAANAAGYGCARLVIHPDGRIEVIAEKDAPAPSLSPYDDWKRSHG